MKALALFRANLDRLIDEAGMSPADFARAMGRTEPWVSNLRAGKRGTTFATLDAVASKLNVPIAAFFVDAESDQIRHGKDQESARTGAGSRGLSAAASTTEARILKLEGELAASRDTNRRLLGLLATAKEDAERLAKKLGVPDISREGRPPRRRQARR